MFGENVGDIYKIRGDEMSIKKGFKSFFKKKKWVKWVIIVLIIAGVFFYLKSKGKDAADSIFTKEEVKLRDIKTFHSFTGTVEPVNSNEVMPEISGIKVKEVKVKEGDEVKEGDVLMTLDTYSIQKQIDQLKAQMKSSKDTNSLSVEQAKKSYDDLKESVDKGLNSSIQGAKNSMDSSFASLVSAQNAYNDEVKLNNEKLSDVIKNSIEQCDKAYDSVLNAQNALEQARVAENQAESDYNDASSDYDEAVSKFGEESAKKLKRSKEAAQNSLERAKLNTSSASQSLESAWDSYKFAKSGFEAAKMKEESGLTSLYNSLITAQTNYLNAVDSYNSAVLSVNQQLAGYKLSIRQAKVQGDQSLNNLQLKDLEKQLKDCTIKAPATGIITSLPAQKGTFTSSTASLCTITDFGEMKIVIKIGEYDIQGVNENDNVEILIDALGKKTYEGTIKHIDKTATVVNGVSFFKAEVSIKADQETRSGMSAEVKLVIDDLKNVVTVSSEAIQTDEDGSYFVNVYGKDGVSIEKKKITIGATDGSYTQVTSGLSEKDTVLVSNISDMTSGLTMGYSSDDNTTGDNNGTDKE